MHKFVLVNNVRLEPDTEITDAIKKSPWLWTGATRLVSGTEIPHTKDGNPVRWFYERYVRAIEPKERLTRIRDYSSLDVNPWHYDCNLPKLFRQETIDEVPQDLAEIPAEAQFGDPADEATMIDLTEAFYEVYRKKPFSTWDQYHEAMKDVFAGVLPRDQLNVLSRMGVNLKGAPKYVG